MLLRGSRQMFQETKVGQTTAKQDLLRLTALNQLLNEPQLQHVQANENSVVSEPLQRACSRPRNTSESTQEKEAGPLWRSLKRHVGTITKSKKTHKMAEEWKLL